MQGKMKRDYQGPGAIGLLKPMVRKTRAKPGAKYRSKEDKRLTWSGRGWTPRWMRDEMRVDKLRRTRFSSRRHDLVSPI
jgi:H-NS histone family